MMPAPIVITGASSGIGLAVARSLLSDQIPIVATARNEERLSALYGDSSLCSVVPCDLSHVDQACAYIDAVKQTHGLVGGFVHCAGFDKMSPLYLNKASLYEELWKVHALAPMMMISRLARKGMMTDGASIVLVSSLAAHEGAAGHSAYAAAKGALEGFLPSAAAELAERHIRINMVVLGIVHTDMSQGYMRRLTEPQLQALESRYPLGFGDPDHVVGALRFLLGSASSWMTGQKIFLDGGHSIS